MDVKANNGGRGVDVCLDALNHTAPATVSIAGIWALRRGGRFAPRTSVWQFADGDTVGVDVGRIAVGDGLPSSSD